MNIEIFGSSVQLLPATSPLPGRLAATAIDWKQKIWSDLFLQDPMNGLINFESEVLDKLMRNAKVRQSRWLGVVLGVRSTPTPTQLKHPKSPDWLAARRASSCPK